MLFTEVWKAITQPFKNLWASMKEPFVREYEEEEVKDEAYYESYSRDKLNDYAYNEYKHPKTFDEWLAEQGLSSDESSDDYFGSFFEKEGQSLIDQAYSSYQNSVMRAKSNATKYNSLSHSNYLRNALDYSQDRQELGDKGLLDSGLDNYLKGIAYLAYRDEISKNNSNLQSAMADALATFSDKKYKTEADVQKDIANREDDLLRYFYEGVEANTSLLRP